MQFISCSNDLRKYLDMPFEDNIEFNTISTDTRSIEKDSLFIAIKGPNFDGNNYIDEAFNKGAVAVLCSDEKYKDNPNKACIYVSSVKKRKRATHIYDLQFSTRWWTSYCTHNIMFCYSITNHRRSLC